MAANTILGQRITTWRRTETRLRTLRVAGNPAAVDRAEATLRDLAHQLDCSGHAWVAGQLAREAALVGKVSSRRRVGVSDPELNAQLARVRAHIATAR